MDFENLLASIPRLFDLLDERAVGYVLVGGIAMRVHSPGRNTQDIGLIIPEADLDRIHELRILDQNESFARAEFGQLQVDILLANHDLFDLVREKHARRESFVERSIVCATVKGLLLLKLFALPSLYRQGQFSRVEDYEHDISVLIREHRPSMELIFDELKHHLTASDLSEVRSIVAGIQQRIADSKARFGGTSQDPHGWTSLGRGCPPEQRPRSLKSPQVRPPPTQKNRRQNLAICGPFGAERQTPWKTCRFHRGTEIVATLTQALAAGDPEAFAATYDRFAARLFAVATTMSDNDHSSPDGRRLPERCDDTALEARIAALAPPPPGSLRHHVLAAVGKRLDASSATNSRSCPPEGEPVWGVLAGACAVALTLTAAPWISMPSPAVQRPVFSGLPQELLDGRVADISQQRNQLLQSLASTERLPVPVQTGSRLALESAAGTTLRPLDLPKILNGPL